MWVKRMLEQMLPVQETELVTVDSIPFVLSRDSIDYHLLTDSIHLKIDTWRWYADGYRYPVFKSIKNVVCSKPAKERDLFSTSFYYPPNEQYYGLTNDVENQIRREKEILEDKMNISGEKQVKIFVNITNSGVLHMNCVLLKDEEITMGLFDFKGRQLSHIHKKNAQKGNNELSLMMNSYSNGEYLLQIRVDGVAYGEKIIWNANK